MPSQSECAGQCSKGDACVLRRWRRTDANVQDDSGELAAGRRVLAPRLGIFCTPTCPPTSRCPPTVPSTLRRRPPRPPAAARRWPSSSIPRPPPRLLRALPLPSPCLFTPHHHTTPRPPPHLLQQPQRRLASHRPRHPQHPQNPPHLPNPAQQSPPRRARRRRRRHLPQHHRSRPSASISGSVGPLTTR